MSQNKMLDDLGSLGGDTSQTSFGYSPSKDVSPEKKPNIFNQRNKQPTQKIHSTFDQPSVIDFSKIGGYDKPETSKTNIPSETDRTHTATSGYQPFGNKRPTLSPNDTSSLANAGRQMMQKNNTSLHSLQTRQSLAAGMSNRQSRKIDIDKSYYQ